MLGKSSPSLASGIFWQCLTMSDRNPISQCFVLGEWVHLIFRQQIEKRCGIIVQCFCSDNL